MEVHCKDSHRFVAEDPDVIRNERKTLWVVILTGTMMVVEVIAGYWSGSMALLADGWHMGSHLGALLIAFMAYRLSRSHSVSRRFSFGGGKLIPLGGYTSAIILAGIAITMAVESVNRLRHPEVILFSEAIGVAFLGLLVNLLSAFLLRGHDHHHEHGHDHNMRSAYIHVLADAFTSILAIFALAIGMWKGIIWLDPVVGLIGVVVILSWSVQLCRDTALDLLDAHPQSVDFKRLKELVEKGGTEIVDFHIWRVAPKAMACELIVKAPMARGAPFYRQIIEEEFGIHHIVIEERIAS